jgi:hypothetical protein
VFERYLNKHLHHNVRYSKWSTYTIQ